MECTDDLLNYREHALPNSPRGTYSSNTLVCLVYILNFIHKLYANIVIIYNGFYNAAFPCYDSEDCSGPEYMAVYSGRHCCAHTTSGHYFHSGTTCYKCIGM